jgi:anti-anti-sigma regulatory factor
MTTLLTRAPDQATTLPEQSAPSPPTTTAPAGSRSSAPARPAAPRLVLTGALSRSDISELEPRLEELVETGARTVEVDLSCVQSMDGAVARLLLRTSWHLGDPGRALLLLHPRPQVRRVLRFYGAGHLVVP